MSAPAPPAGSVKQFTLPFTVDTREWLAIRELGDPCPGWYFMDKTLRTTVREPPVGKYSPEGLFPAHLNKSDLLAVAHALDEWFLKSNVGSVLSRLMTGGERALHKRAHAAKPYADSYPADSRLEPLQKYDDEQLLGNLSWTHFSFGVQLGREHANFPVHAGLGGERLQQAVADAITHSDPDEGTWGPDDQVAWYQLVMEIHKPDMSPVHPAVLQKLAAAPSGIASHVPARHALAELLTSQDKQDGPQAALLAGLLRRFKPAGHALSGPGRPGDNSYSSSLTGQHSGRTVSFASRSLSGSADVEMTDGGASSADAAASERQALGSVVMSADEIAVSRLVQEFLAGYHPAVGRKLLQSDGPKLQAAMAGIASSDAWHSAVMALLEQDDEGERFVDDPFLQRFVRIACSGDSARRAEIARVPVLAGDVAFAGQLAADGLIAAAGGDPIGSFAAKPASSNASFSASARRSLIPVLGSELAALLAADVSAAVVTSLVEGTVGEEALKSARDCAAMPPTSDPALVHEPTTLFAAARAARARQELALGVLGRHGQLTATWLAVNPADPSLLLFAGATANNLETYAASGPYEAGLRVRRLSLAFWSAHRARQEFFPEEGSESLDASSGAAAAVTSSVGATRPEQRPADTGSALPTVSGNSVAGEDLVGRELEERAARSGAVRCLSKDQAADFCRSLQELVPFMFDDAQYALYSDRRDELRLLIAGRAVSDAEGNADLDNARYELNQAEAYLVSYAFVLRLMCCPDVLALLLHTLFHPGVAVDDLAAEMAGAQSATENLGLALAWAASVAGASGERRNAVTALTESASSHTTASTVLILGDSGLSAPFLSVPLVQGVSSYIPTPMTAGEAATMDASVARSALAHTLTEAGRACKPGQALQTLLSQAFSTSATVAAGIADNALAAQEAELLVRGCVHPLVACGVIHWTRHMLLAPGVFDDAKVLRIAPIYGRMALAAAERWPLLAPNALALLRSALQLSPPYVDAAALAPSREALAGQLADLALLTGYALPVLAFVHHGIVCGGIEAAVGCTFLSRFTQGLACTRTEGLSSSFSMTFALALMHFVDAFQQKQANLAEAMRRPPESILQPSQQVRAEFEGVLLDIARLLTLRAHAASQAEIVADKTAGFSREQIELLRLREAVLARVI